MFDMCCVRSGRSNEIRRARPNTHIRASTCLALYRDAAWSLAAWFQRSFANELACMASVCCPSSSPMGPARLAIRTQAVREGMTSLREAGLQAVLDGHTTAEEVARETPATTGEAV